MPLYEYECGSCGHRFEKIQRFSDPLVSECPSCGKGPVNKLLSAPAFQFKGTGWYVTDYAGKKPEVSQASREKAEEKADRKADGKADGKADTKVETKTETKAESKSDSATSASGPAAPASGTGPSKD